MDGARGCISPRDSINRSLTFSKSAIIALEEARCQFQSRCQTAHMNQKRPVTQKEVSHQMESISVPTEPNVPTCPGVSWVCHGGCVVGQARAIPPRLVHFASYRRSDQQVATGVRDNGADIAELSALISL